MTTDKTPATLATAKHGGCVQLPTSERERFEAWGRAERLPLARGKLGGYAFEVTAKAWLAWQYLSAQPSPGGQGDAWAIKLARESAFAHSNEHAYLPQTREEANRWQPHAWVVAAIHVAALGAPRPPAEAGDLMPRPMDTAPRDDTMVRLLVQFEDHATEDTVEPAWTIGVCNDDNVCDDARIGWQFAGWCWTRDHFTEGKGTPVGWLPLIESQAAGNG